MSPFERLVQSAEAGDLMAARMVVGVLLTSADGVADPVPWLDPAVIYARTAAAHSLDRWDIGALVYSLMKRAAFPDGEAAGGEAVSIIETDANDGDEESAAGLQMLSDSLPPDLVALFFAEAKRQLRDFESDRRGGAS